MNLCRILFAAIFLTASALAAGEAKPNTLTAKEIQEGWILLFDGESSFGWKVASSDEANKPDSSFKNGDWILGGSFTSATLTSQFTAFEMQFDYRTSGSEKARLSIDAETAKGEASKTWTVQLEGGKGGEWVHATIRLDPEQKSAMAIINGKELQFKVARDMFGRPASLRFAPAAAKEAKLHLRNIRLHPLATRSIFNGRDLTGWRVFPGEKYKSKYTVTNEGWLNVKNGPGDLQTAGTYADFVLQLECISNGPALNSGIFFRCIADQYQNGYEMQIQNGFKDGDRSKPADAGTGAIYRRVAARRVIPDDGKWFGMTLLAHGKHLATWVDGIQVVDWTDDRPADDNPRKGSRTAAGHISIQGHDATTDLSFRNLRIADWKK